MERSSVWPTDDAETIVHIYGNMLFRLCFVMLGNDTDAEDAVQETILKYLQKAPSFENSEHEKAWLITVAKNECRNILRFKQRHQQISLEFLEDIPFESSDSGILEALMSIPEKFRLVLRSCLVSGQPPHKVIKLGCRKGRRQMRKSYPSDISRKQFEEIREDLERAKKKTHPRSYDLYDIFCAILYLLKEGCTWRAIPHDFPKWQNVRYHYDIWSNPDEDGISVLDRVLRKLVEAEREKNGRSAQATMLIVDSKSIQNADTAGKKGYDAGKKYLG